MSHDKSDSIDGEATISRELHGSRFDQAAAILFPEFSRSRLQSYIGAGTLTLDGKAVRAKDKVAQGQHVLLAAAVEPAVSWSGDSRPLDIVYEDEHLLVVNKPTGVVVHPAAGHADGTLVNSLIGYAPELEQLPRGGIVHRLDKDTTGIMFVARSYLAHQSLVKQLAARSVKRIYAAVCRGALSGGGSVDAPIGRHPSVRTRMAVTEGGKPSVTHYRIAERFGHHTALSVSLETGRTHQIRVHLASRNNPLIGDPLYGGRPRPPAGASTELQTMLRTFSRQALHAQTLAFDHPATGERCQFETPLPDDLVGLLDVLRTHDANQLL